MVIFEEVQKQFPVRSIAAYGRVVVVPKAEFKMDWDHALGAEGCSITPLDVDEKASVLVGFPKKETVTNEKLVEKRKRKARLGTWMPDQEELLLKEWPKQKGAAMVRARALMELFPKRNANSIYQHYWLLSKKPNNSPDSTPKRTPKSTPKVIDRSQVEEPMTDSSVRQLLTQIRDALVPRSFCFDYHCRSCGSLGNGEDRKVWRFCPVCGEALVVWNVQEVSK